MDAKEMLTHVLKNQGIKGYVPPTHPPTHPRQEDAHPRPEEPGNQRVGRCVGG